MIVPVHPQSVQSRETSLVRGLPSVAEGRERRGGSSARADLTPPSIRIGNLVVESSTPISTAAIRDGFREAWLGHDHTACLWLPQAFRGALAIDFPPGATGRELGRRIAEAILQRAGVP